MTEGLATHSDLLVEQALTPKMKMRQFFILMWKQFTVRKARFIATPFELLSPCIFFIFLAMMRSILTPEIPLQILNSTLNEKQPLELYSKGMALAKSLLWSTSDPNSNMTKLAKQIYEDMAEKYPALKRTWRSYVENALPLLEGRIPQAPKQFEYSEPLPLDNPFLRMLVLYTPNSNLTDALMDEVGKRLRIDRLNSFPIPDAYTYFRGGYYPFSNSSMTDLNRFILEMGSDAAVVFFDGMDAGTWPEKLNYTIRMKVDFKTHIYRSPDDVGNHASYGYRYGNFMRLQWAIDSSFLTLTTGRNVSQKLWLQEFPYRNRFSNEALSAVLQVLRYTCAFSLLLPFVFLLTRLMEERATGVQELIRMVGVSNNDLMYSHFVNMLPVGLLYAICGTIVLKVTNSPFVPRTDGFLIFVMLFLHFCSIMALAFVCSYLTKSAQYATTLSVLCFVVLWMPVEHRKWPQPFTLLTGFLPHVPMNWFWDEVDAVVIPGGSVGLSNMWTSHSRYSGSVALSLLMMCLQTAVFLNLAWYLSMVLPGKYGVGQPWNFLLQRSYWLKKRVEPDSHSEGSEEEAMPAKDSTYYEEPGCDAPREVGVRINNVYKKFGKDYALSNVSFDVYKGEITVLLGHNGAGKTTLMSIITGMMSASAGKVFVGGLDVSSAGGEFRRQLGMCPQHNLFFPDLSVLQHVVFFAMLKGTSYKDAWKSSMELLSRLGIDEKADSKSGELSGGMKRRLQLACALAGGASVLILDEPTSGLDVETRRQLWDLLLTLRGDRTVLLTTHFMEEADALGDRVAALHKGRLKCHATPMHLKKNVGTGYRLSLTTIGVPREGAITRLIASILEGATLKESSLNSISYNLPAQHSHLFPQLFAALEANRSQLGIDSIGVGVSSLEEVFLKLCSDVDTKFNEESVDSALPEPTYNLVSGWRLRSQQVWALMQRQARYILAKKTSFFILQIFLPLLAIFFFTVILSGAREDEANRNRLAAMNLDMYSDIFSRKVLYNTEGVPEDTVKKIAAYYNNVTFQKVPDVQEFLTRAAKAEDLSEYNKYQVAVEVNNTDVKIHFTTLIHHAAPVALNLASNMLAEQSGERLAITTNNHPLETRKAVQALFLKMHQPKDFYACIIWAIFVVCIIVGALMNAVTLPIKERVSGTRHIHIMSGCPPAVHWLVTLLFHMLVFTTLLLLPTAAIALLDKEMTLNQPAFIGALILVLEVGSAAFLAFCYLISFSFGERGAGLFLVVIMLVFGLIPGALQATADILNQSLETWSIPVAIPNYIFPTATMTSALILAANIARINAYCDLNVDKCPNIEFFMGLDVEQCCALGRGPVCTFCMKDSAPVQQIITLAVQLLVYITLVILTQYGAFNSLYDRIVNWNYRPRPTRFKDEMVRAEKTYVSKGITLPPKQIGDAMLVNDIHKNYFSLLKPRSPCNAVKGVSFSVKKGECFGLLGVNGAGKSTTFKMIAGEECSTRGGVFANGHHLKWPRGQYLQSLGYCPQFFGLDKFLTGRENLSLLLTLRGLAQTDVDAESDCWIQVVGLERYSDAPVSGYSGGCMRRLATAAALSSGAAVTLLDEPTSGVDVSARRRVWLALRRGLRNNRAVIITSHSMDEMEALCDRIAIMSGGSLGALGSACSLRAAHAAGHALVLKLGCSLAVGDVVDTTDAALQSLKEYLNRKFNCTLKDEHKTMLHYHINESMRYSELFSALEQLKLEFPQLVEDYSVTETTLEEVFLSFAQPHQDPDPHGEAPVRCSPV